jgi:hypothetical protein
MTKFCIVMRKVGHYSTPKYMYERMLYHSDIHDNTPKCVCTVYDTISRSDT